MSSSQQQLGSRDSSSVIRSEVRVLTKVRVKRAARGINTAGIRQSQDISQGQQGEIWVQGCQEARWVKHRSAETQVRSWIKGVDNHAATVL